MSEWKTDNSEYNFTSTVYMWNSVKKCVIGKEYYTALEGLSGPDGFCLEFREEFTSAQRCSACPLTLPSRPYLGITHICDTPRRMEVSSLQPYILYKCICRGLNKLRRRHADAIQQIVLEYVDIMIYEVEAARPAFRK